MSMSRILIVDDSEEIRSNLSEILGLMDFEVVVACSGNEALGKLHNDSFDLVVTDLNMPDMDGWILASRIKKRSPDTPIVLITGSEQSAVIEGLKTSNVDSVLFKPFSLKDFQGAVHAALTLKTSESRNAGSGRDPHGSMAMAKV
jgi:CheY-like chemotaxis protein